MLLKTSSRAVEKWRRIVGEANVLADEASIAPYAANTSGVRRLIPAVIRPANADEVREVVLIANECRFPIHPISCGRNWGLGSRLPINDGVALLDLSRMNRIREVNVKAHYAVIEPGVTQRQLHEYLRENDIPLLVNVTGSAMETSLIGNSLDRGIGYFASRADSLSGLEIVLGNGDELKTGFAHFKDCRISHMYRYGIGPGLDGLFFQSNFGIVTAAGIDLIPKAESQMVVISKIDRHEKLPAFIDALLDLRRREIIRTVVHVGNRDRTFITLAPLLYKQLKRWAPGSDETLRVMAEQMLEKEGFGPWSAVIGVMGTAGQVRAARREISEALRGIAKTMFLNDFLVNSAKRLGALFNFLPWVRRKESILLAVEPLYGLANGIPSDAPMNSVYWPLGRMPVADNEDPDQSQCGMLYTVPFLPPDGETARLMMDHTDRVFRKYGFVPCTTLNLVNSKSIECVISLPFDREQPGQVAAAHRCNDELTESFIRHGCLPYRLGVQSMSMVLDDADPYWKTVRELKRVLDPNNIISPGRYNLV